MITTIHCIGPVREPSPCCWDGQCIHCRERNAEQVRIHFAENARLRQRHDTIDRPGNPSRATLGLLPRHFGQRPPPRAQNAPGAELGLLPARPARRFGTSVLPLNFHLAWT